MATHQWYYIKPGMISDETVGPLAQSEFLALVRQGKIARDGAISSPTFTHGQWVELQNIPKLLEIWVTGKESRDAKAKGAKEAAQQDKADARRRRAAAQQEKADARRQREAERQAQAQAAERRREEAHRTEMDRRAAAPVPAQQPAHQHAEVAHPPSQTVIVAGSQSQAIPMIVTCVCTPGWGHIVQGRVGTGFLVMLVFWLSVITIIGPFIVWVWALLDVAKYNPSTVTVTRS